MKKLFIFLVLFFITTNIYANIVIPDFKKAEEAIKFTKELINSDRISELDTFAKDRLSTIIQSGLGSLKSESQKKIALEALAIMNNDPLSVTSWVLENLNADTLTIGGFISQSYYETSANKLPKQGYRGTEVGINASIDATKYLTFSGQYSYKPYMSWENDDDNLFLDYAVADGHIQITNNLVFGVRYGQLLTPYGFFNYHNTNPVHRQGISLYRGIYFDYQPQVFESGRGQGAYVFGSLFGMTYSFEYIDELKREDARDEINYTHAIGLELDEVRMENYKHIELDSRYFAIRWNKARHITEGRITNEYWANTLPAGTPPALYPYLGFVDVHLDIEYQGIQIYHPDLPIDFTYEKHIATYLLNGNFDEIGALLGLEMKEWKEYRHHALLRYSDKDLKTQFFAGYGWNPSFINGTYNSERERTWEKYVGIKNQSLSDELILRAEYHDVYGVYILADAINPLNNDERTDKWNYWAVSLTYGF